MCAGGLPKMSENIKHQWLSLSFKNEIVLSLFQYFKMFTSPARRLVDELYPYFHPFASYRPQNALEGFATSSLPLEDNVSDGTGLQV